MTPTAMLLPCYPGGTEDDGFYQFIVPGGTYVAEFGVPDDTILTDKGVGGDEDD